MESSFLEQDSAVEKAANVPAAIKVLFDEMNEKPATTFEEVDIPSEVDVITKAGSLVIDCYTQCPPAQSSFYIGGVWNIGARTFGTISSSL